MNAGLILGEVLVMFSMQELTPLFSVTKLVNAVYYQLGPDFQWPGERHDFWEVVYVDRGEAVGMGTHEELMKTCEVYREIATSQLSAAELA